MKQPPLDMGDIFVVDDGKFGITVKDKGGKTWKEILDMWPQEKEKDFSYEDFEHHCFFNDIGTNEVTKWLWSRKTGLELDAGKFS